MEPVLSFNNWISFEDRIRDLPIYQLFSDFRRYDIKDISQKLFTQASSTLLDFSRNITFSSAQICGQYDNSRLALKSWVSLVRPISFLINFCKALGFILPPEGALCSPKDSIALSTKHSVIKLYCKSSLEQNFSSNFRLEEGGWEEDMISSLTGILFILAWTPWKIFIVPWRNFPSDTWCFFKVWFALVFSHTPLGTGMVWADTLKFKFRCKHVLSTTINFLPKA